MIVMSKNGVLFQIDAEDYDIVKLNSWNAYDFSGTRYLNSSDNDGNTIYLHRVVMDAPKGTYVDHINRNGLDNRKFNLRIVGQRKNLANAGMFSSNTSGFRGVTKYRGGWRGQTKIRFNGNQYCVSTKTYTNKTDAAIVRDEVMRRIHGNTVFLNFPQAKPTGQLLKDCNAIESRFASRGIIFSAFRLNDAA